MSYNESLDGATRGNDRPTDRSRALYEQASQYIPGATQLVSRRPHIFAPGVAPTFFQHAKGPRLWDVDGQEYIDYGMSVSACILGYADSRVNAAVRAQIDDGVQSSLNHPLEIELAQRLCETIACAEMVRFAKGGGEACTVAVRIARGVTGRDKVLFCGYHGWHDWYLAANLNDEGSLAQHLLPGIEPLGVPRSLAGMVFPFPYGDVAALERLLARHAGEVACVIMEPMRSELPPPGYLQQVRQLTQRHDVVLIFDEVTTGFRHAVGGVQQLTGVVPDMAVFAKSLGNGYAMAAIVGVRAVMQPAAQMFISSTNWSELVGIRAALVTLEEIRRRDVPGLLHEFGSQLAEGFERAAAELGIDARFVGHPATPRIEFRTPGDGRPSPELAALYFQEMARRGILINASPRHSAAHGASELETTHEASREALRVVRDALRAGDVERRLVVKATTPVFRRLVH